MGKRLTGINDVRFPSIRKATGERDESHPAIAVDLDACG